MAKKPVKKAKPAAKKTASAPAKKTTAKTAASGSTQKTTSASKPKNTSTLSYTLSEFVENIRGFTGLTKRSQAKELVGDIAAFVTDALKRGYKIPLMGLGKMYVRQTSARTGRNPATGATIQIPAKKRVKFTVAKALKDTVLNK